MAFEKKIFGRDIKTKRLIDENISLTKLSVKLGIHRSLIHRLETGTAIPDVNTFDIFCKWLGTETKKYLK